MNTFIESAAEKNTSVEILEAILHISKNYEDVAELCWETGLIKALMNIVIKMVTQDGKLDTTEFHWGNAGTEWATLKLWNGYND